MIKLIINNNSKIYILLYCINNRKMVFEAYVYGVQEQSNCKKQHNKIFIFIFLRIVLTKHPDVAGWGKPTKVYGFWSHPFNRQFPFRSWKTHTTVYRLYLNVLPYQLHRLLRMQTQHSTNNILNINFSISILSLNVPSESILQNVAWLTIGQTKNVLQSSSLRTISKSNMPSLSTRGRYFLILGAFQKDAYYLH